MKRIVAAVMIVLILMQAGMGTALLEGGNTPQEKLDYGILLLEIYLTSGGVDTPVQLDEIVDQFKSVGSYGHARGFYQYAYLLQCIEEEKYVEAEAYKELLRFNDSFKEYVASEEFANNHMGICDVNVILEYCKARKLEADGQIDAARDIYLEYSNFYDAMDRFLKAATPKSTPVIVKASAQGYQSPVAVTVTVNGNVIEALLIGDERFNELIGAQALEASFINQFIGKTLPIKASDIDAITAATMTTNAVINALNNAYEQINAKSGYSSSGPVIDKQATVVVASIGETVSVDLQATGYGLTYQWYVKNPGKKSFVESTVSDGVYSYEMTEEKSGREIYCLVSDDYGNVVESDIFALVAREDTAAYQLAVLNAAYRLEEDETMLEPAYLTGTITAINEAWSKKNGSITVTIVCNGDKDKAIECYRMVGDEAKSLSEGDIITVNGVLENWRGTVQFAKGCTLESVTKVATPKPTKTPTLSPTKAPATKVPATKAPATKAPATQKPATKKPTTPTPTPAPQWGSWSSWSTTAVESSSTRKVESKTQYRYKTRETTSSDSSSLSGWTLISGPNYSSWSGTSETSSKPSEGDLLQIVSTTQTKWGWYHYCCNKYDGGYNVDSIKYGSGSHHYHSYTTSSALSKSSVGDMGGKTSYKGKKCSCNFQIWFRDTSNDGYTYSYQTRSVSYTFENWSDWSSWQDGDVPSSNSNLKVETRTVYRYKDLK